MIMVSQWVSDKVTYWAVGWIIKLSRRRRRQYEEDWLLCWLWLLVAKEPFDEWPEVRKKWPEQENTKICWHDDLSKATNFVSWPLTFKMRGPVLESPAEFASLSDICVKNGSKVPYALQLFWPEQSKKSGKFIKIYFHFGTEILFWGQLCPVKLQSVPAF